MSNKINQSKLAKCPLCGAPATVFIDTEYNKYLGHSEKVVVYLCNNPDCEFFTESPIMEAYVQ